MKMKRRIFFIALAIALPLALVLPLRTMRSWQPRMLPLEARVNDNVTSFFWRPNGLFLTRSTRPLQSEPLTLDNWNGQSVTLRATIAHHASLDARGKTAAIIRQLDIGTALEHDVWDVEASKKFGLFAKLKGGKKQQHKTSGARYWVISPDGERAAWFSPSLGSVQIGPARSAQAEANFALRPISHPDALAFSPDGSELAISGGAQVQIIDAQSGQLKRQWRLKWREPQDNIVWSPNGKTIALFWGHAARNATGANVNTSDGLVFLHVFDAQSGARLAGWSQSRGATEPSGVTNAAFSPDGKTLAFGTYDGNAHWMNVKSGAIERHFPTPGASSLANAAHYVAFAPDGRTLAVATQDKITLWRAK